MTRPRSSLPAVFAVCVLLISVGGGALSGTTNDPLSPASAGVPARAPDPAAITITRGTAVNVPLPPAGQVLVRPSRTPVVLSSELTYTGEPVTVTCGTCHTTRPANLQNGQEGRVPAEFHQGLQYRHGAQSCVSCHNAANFDTLRRADGRAIAFPEAKELCSQCHGPQARDYAAGAHGGMQGSWDLSKGGRVRNTCTDCHDPHSPKFVQLRPVFAPVDKGAREQAARAAAHAAHSAEHGAAQEDKSHE